MPALVPKRLFNLKICVGSLKGVQSFSLTKTKGKTAERKSSAKQGDPSLLVAVDVSLGTELGLFSGSTDAARRRVRHFGSSKLQAEFGSMDSCTIAMQKD